MERGLSMGWGMIKFYGPLWSTLLLCFLFAACSESPNNDPGAKQPPVVPELRFGQPGGLDKFLTPDLFVDPDSAGGIGSKQYEALKNANLHKPIIYGVGGGGINLNTTFEESRTLLTPPDRGPFANGLTFYNEQVIVLWNLNGSGKPFVIVLSSGYLGSLDAGRFGKLTSKLSGLGTRGRIQKQVPML